MPTDERRRSTPPNDRTDPWGTRRVDFMADALYDRRRFRALTIIDEGNREDLAIDVGRSIPVRRMIRVLEELIALHGRPAALRIACYEQVVKLSAPLGSPIERQIRARAQ